MSYLATTHRSRSPVKHPISKSRRSRSPGASHSHSRHHHSFHKRPQAPRPAIIPFQASTLSKHDFNLYKPMFGLYLDIQKQLVLDELSDEKVRGRWKSFVGKWNRGELAEGWYDPATLRKAQASLESTPQTAAPWSSRHREAKDECSDEDAVGPALPDEYNATHKVGKRSGPTIPNLQDLEFKRELASEDSLERHQVIRQEQHQDRKMQKERLDDIVPRAEAGSKDRMLEKKREKADNNRAFASAKTEGDGVEDVPEAVLLGDVGGIEGFKVQKHEMERKKNEREIRREQILRARHEERDQRVKIYKAKEEKTMSGLIALAKTRFG